MTNIDSISFWEKEAVFPLYDCIIIGAGFVGLSSAIYMKEANPLWNIVVLERGAISYGASTRNAGFACFGTIGELEDDRKSIPIDEIVNTVKQRWNGLQNLCTLIPANEMAYENLGGTELFSDEESFLQAAEQLNFWNNLLKNIIGDSVFEIVEQPHDGFYHKAIYNKFEGQLNPKSAIDQLYKICRQNEITILTGINVESWYRKELIVHVLSTTSLSFRTKKLALATNAFTKNILPGVAVQPARNQVLVTEPFDNAWNGCYHYNRGYIYFRSIGNRLLLGGARYLSDEENTHEYGNTATIQEFLSSFLYERLSGEKLVEIEHWWSGILGVGDKKSPIIAKYSDQIYLAVRLGGMGVAIGTSVGKQLAELIIDE